MAQDVKKLQELSTRYLKDIRFEHQYFLHLASLFFEDRFEGYFTRFEQNPGLGHQDHSCFLFLSQFNLVLVTAAELSQDHLPMTSSVHNLFSRSVNLRMTVFFDKG